MYSTMFTASKKMKIAQISDQKCKLICAVMLVGIGLTNKDRSH